MSGVNLTLLSNRRATVCRRVARVVVFVGVGAQPALRALAVRGNPAGGGAGKPVASLQ